MAYLADVARKLLHHQATHHRESAVVWAVARGALLEAARLGPGDAQVRYHLGGVHAAQGDAEAAIAAYREVIRLAAGYGAAWKALAITYQAIGQTGAADVRARAGGSR